MTRVLISAEAAHDLDDIWLHIAQDSPVNADRMIDRIHETAENTLARYPHSGRARDEFGEGLRSFSVDNYIIFYTPIEDGIAVVRVFHGARDLTSIFDQNK